MGTAADPGLSDWEFDAPQFFDFTRLTGEGNEENDSPRASLWFSAPAVAGKGAGQLPGTTLDKLMEHPWNSHLQAPHYVHH
jgi:hypothetical protein